MQSFTIDTGKTRDELLALTETTDLGEVTYNPKLKIFYQDEWQTIIPNKVAIPEIDGTELDYYYKDTVLKKNAKYCAQLYWKAGCIIQTGEPSDLFTTEGDSTITKGTSLGGNFNIQSGMVDTIFYTTGIVSSNIHKTLGFAVSDTLGGLFDITDILQTTKKVPGLNRCIPTLDYDYCYCGNKTLAREKLSVIYHSSPSGTTSSLPVSYLFGHALSYDSTATPKITVTNGNDNDEQIVMTYTQPESNVDDHYFYNFGSGSSTADIFKNFPQGLPIGVPMIIAPAFNTSNTNVYNNRKTLVAPFIFYILGITETPEET